MDRHNPYEQAFEAYLKAHGLCYVAVDETRRSSFAETPVKNLDFIVLGPRGARLLVDVKGRQFPGGPPERPRYVWQNWSTQEDIDGLTRWTELFGPSYTALFVFLYRILPTVTLPEETPDLWRFRDTVYLLRAVTLADYHRHLRVRSPKWGTVGLPGAKFRALVQPFQFYSDRADNASEGGDHGENSAERLVADTRAALAASAARGPTPRRARS